MPERDDEGARPAKRAGSPGKFRRPPEEIVARAARAVVRGGKAAYPSLSSFRAAVVASLRHDEPLATVGGARLRRLLVGVPGVRLSVHYTEKGKGPLPHDCPICGDSLVAIRNRTLGDETIELGRQCRRCGYWTHAARRVPVRYTITSAESRRRAATSR